MTMTTVPFCATRETPNSIPWADEAKVSAMARTLRAYRHVPPIGDCAHAFTLAGFTKADIDRYGLAARVLELTRRRAMGVGP